MLQVLRVKWDRVDSAKRQQRGEKVLLYIIQEY